MKLKLIDVLDIIESGELEEGARVIWDGNEYIYDGGDSLWRTSEYHDSTDIFEDICLGNLREEVELIEPKKECEHEWKMGGIRDTIDPLQVVAFQHCEKCGMTKIMETSKQKEHTIEGYDIDGYEIEEIDYVKWAMATKDIKLQILMDKIKELTQKVNAQTTVLLSQEREIKEIKEQLDY